MRALWKDAESGVRVVRLTEAAEVEALICLFEAIAVAEGWQPEGALQGGRERSVYFALERRGQPVGGLQLALPDRAGRLPCQALWPEAAVGPNAAHVAILALAEPLRGEGRLFWALGVELWRYCVASGIATLFLEVTPRVLPLYRRLGWPLQQAGERRQHWGEDCYLCSLGVPEVAAALLRKAERSPYYRRIVAQAFRLPLSARQRPPSRPPAWEAWPAPAAA